MNRRGLIKAGVFGILVLLAIGITILTTISITSTAIIEQDTYVLGENIKINLDDISEYTLKIKTPSTSVIKEGSDETFLYSPQETGRYSLVLDYGGIREIYSFDVIHPDDITQTENNQVGTKKERSENFPIEIKPDDETIELPEIIHEGILAEEPNIFLDRPVKWLQEETITPGTSKTRITLTSYADNITVYARTDTGRKQLDPKIKHHTISNLFKKVISLKKGYRGENN